MSSLLTWLGIACVVLAVLAVVLGWALSTVTTLLAICVVLFVGASIITGVVRHKS